MAIDQNAGLGIGAAGGVSDDVIYDNTTSGLSADTVQEAIDELALGGGPGGGISPTLFDANTILKADVDDTPLALPVGASTFVGRKSTGTISAMSVTEAKTELNYTASDIDNVAAGNIVATDVQAAINELDSEKQAALVNGVDGLTAAEVTQLANIDLNTISNRQWGYVGTLDQNLASTDTVLFNTVQANNVVVQGTMLDGFYIGSYRPLVSFPGGVALQHVVSMDNDTENTIEQAIDTLPNLLTATSLSSVGTITSGIWNGTDIAISDGGTGASDAATARGNLGLAIGSDVQAWSTNLDAINQSLATTDSPTFANVTSSNAPTADGHLTRKDYVDGLLQGIAWQEPVSDEIDLTTSEPVSPTIGDRYINTVTGTSNVTTQSVTINNVYEWNGSSWDELVPSEGWAAWIEDIDLQKNYNGSSWVTFASTTTHGNLSGLQGGAPSEYYHLTATEHTNATQNATTSLTGLLSSTDWNTFNNKQDALTNGVEALTSAEVSQLANIDTSTIDATQWGYVGGLDQALATTESPSFNSVSVGNTGLTVGTSVPFSDSTGTLTLQNVDALDATTEATIESAIDTLSNLTSASSLSSVGTITTGTWAATDIAVADGGTGASDSATARTNLGVAIGSDVQAWSSNLDSINQDLSSTSTPTFASVISNTAPTSPSELTRKDYVDGLLNGLSWRDPVIDEIDLTTAEPASPIANDRYINTVTGTSSVTAQSVTANYIYQWNGASWDEYIPTEGWSVYINSSDLSKSYNGSSWANIGGTSTHNNLSGLQGGQVGEYYHLTATQHTNATQNASGSLTGLLSSADWTTFNSKQDLITNGVDTLDAAEVNQLKNINTETISTSQWGYLAVMNQNVNTSSQVNFVRVIVGGTGLTVGGSTPFSDVTGTLTLQNVDVIDTTTYNTIESQLKLSLNSLNNMTSASSLSTVGTITTGTWNGTNIAISNGGTGARTASEARANLGLELGVDIPANGIKRLRKTATSTSTTTSDDLIAVTDTNATRVITLSNATAAEGSSTLARYITVKDESLNASTGGNGIELVPESGTLDGQASIFIVEDGGCLKVYSDGTNWFTDRS